MSDSAPDRLSYEGHLTALSPFLPAERLKQGHDAGRHPKWAYETEARGGNFVELTPRDRDPGDDGRWLQVNEQLVYALEDLR